jgi:hypothetical protein
MLVMYFQDFISFAYIAKSVSVLLSPDQDKPYRDL